MAAASGEEDDLWDMWSAAEIGRGIGEQVGGAIGAAAELPRGAVATGDIEKKRRAFWDSHPRGVGHQGAKEESTKALLRKDIYFAGLFMPEGP